MRTSGVAPATPRPCLIIQSSPANPRCHALSRRQANLPEAPLALCDQVRSDAGEQPWASRTMRELLQPTHHKLKTHGQRTVVSQARHYQHELACN